MQALVKKEIRIERSAETIYHYLSQPQNFVGLQPLVVEVGNILEGCDETGHVYFDYYAVERLRFLGFIPYPNKINSRMTLLVPNRQIKQEVKAALDVRVYQEITLNPEGQATHISNVVRYEAPALVRSYVHQQIEAAHGYLVQELKRRMENE
jgi:hypothetical protein